jgi:hypothetical protein
LDGRDQESIHDMLVDMLRADGTERRVVRADGLAEKKRTLWARYLALIRV